MKERQRWRAEEDSVLRAYVKKYGPREWSLVSQRMNSPLDRDAKSCLERWKNYLKPGIKKGPLTEEEQRLVIHLQAKHGNKWKKIAVEVPGRTAKRLGKWWEVYKEKHEREQKENNKTVEPIDEGKYDQILETFAQKLVKERPNPALNMPTPNGAIIHNEVSSVLPVPVQPTTSLPPWLSNANPNLIPLSRPPSPSVTLSLSPCSVVSAPVIPWLQPDGPDSTTFSLAFGNSPVDGSPATHGGSVITPEIIECIRDLEEGYRTLTIHNKETAWRLSRVELQLDAERACRKKEKIQEIEAKVKALREEEIASLERIEIICREQLASYRQEAEAKEQMLADRWASKHSRLARLLERIMSS